MTIQDYLSKLNTLYITGNAREHSYRGDLQNLLHTLLPGVLVTNEPARVACGAPDYVLTRKDVPVGYIEAKDIGVDLNGKTLKEQFERYKAGLSNLAITDYLDFHFYKEGVLAAKVPIGKIEAGRVIPLPENFEQFTLLIKNFAETITQTIKSPTRLAEMMAGKAKLMADIIEKSLNSDDETGTASNLKGQMRSFQDMLIHDIDNKSFADIYAQTIAYGMFAARYHDPTLPTFSREEAATLIPKSNPFLRKLFQDIAGYDLDDRLVWIVDELVRIFLATDVAAIMKNFGRSTKQEDPVVHFYETFLASYSPALRKARGVWYTPQPVVNFIVRAVNDILKTEFGLKDGLADTSKIKIKKKAVTKATADKRSKLKEVEEEVEVHKVQILDPATGTGTFLAEVVRHIHKKFEGQQGIWSKYVNKDLIPRLNGFELLMASYAMAHLKMDMLLTETGYKPEGDQRFRIFLTNSLEEHHQDTGSLFSHRLADEANQANAIKRDAPVMVIIGNPPYSGKSANKSKWIMNLMEDYKKEPGGKLKLEEKNSKWINDDYVKFIRFGQHFIEKNGEGVLAFINPHGYLENPTFRGMRWNLLNAFDKIYTIDLHGNGTKKEVSPDGSVDQNIFDILQGVSINLFIKKKQNSTTPAKVFHYDLYGKRDDKYKFLNNHTLKSVPYKELKFDSPNYFFQPKSGLDKEYVKGFQLNEVFSKNILGVVTAKDIVLIDDNIDSLLTKVSDYYSILPNKELVQPLSYRVFDKKYIYYDVKLVERSREAVMKNFIAGYNIGLNVCKIGRSISSYNFFVSNTLTDKNLTSSLDSVNTFPLYLYPESNGQLSTDGEQKRVPNLNPDIVKQIADGLGLEFVPEKEGCFDKLSMTGSEGNLCFANSAEVRPEYLTGSHPEPVEGQTEGGAETAQTFAPIDLLDYIYAVLHSPSYREKYKEFLKIDFPRVPYPTDAAVFWQLVKLGGELRQIHLLESPVVEKPITRYEVDGNNEVIKPRFEPAPSLRGTKQSIQANEVNSADGEIAALRSTSLAMTAESHAEPVEAYGNVYINDTQYFAGVPQVAWNFYIGGYQPAQKWLKDRKGRELSYEDIFHYQKIVVALSETARIMEEIDKVIVV